MMTCHTTHSICMEDRDMLKQISSASQALCSNLAEVKIQNKFHSYSCYMPSETPSPHEMRA